MNITELRKMPADNKQFCEIGGVKLQPKHRRVRKPPVQVQTVVALSPQLRKAASPLDEMWRIQ